MAKDIFACLKNMVRSTSSTSDSKKSSRTKCESSKVKKRQCVKLRQCKEICYAIHVSQGLYKDTSSTWQAVREVEQETGCEIYIPAQVNQALKKKDQVVEVVIQNSDPLLKIFFKVAEPGASTKDLEDLDCSMKVSPFAFNDTDFDDLIDLNELGETLSTLLRDLATAMYDNDVSIFEDSASIFEDSCADTTCSTEALERDQRGLRESISGYQVTY